MKRIALHGVYGKDKYALVDDDDYEYLSTFRWYCTVKGYAVCRNPIKHDGTYKFRMHRLVNKTKIGCITDHINQDKLDNRKVNLRSCDGTVSNFNRPIQKNNKSGHAGVCFDLKANKWRAQIKIHRQTRYLGTFDSIDEAVKRRQEEETSLHISTI